ncbi:MULTISPECIES: hypothetical protein [Mycolicibacter]|nr:MULTISPECIES: hypothetical protein [Mycolicibacter]
MASDFRSDVPDVGVDTVEQLAQLIEKAFGSDGVWTEGRNVR